MAKPRKNSMADSLAKKGKELDINEMKKKVEQLHNSNSPKKEKEVRLSVDVPMSVYLKMKGEVLQKNSTIKQYVLGLIKNDLDIE